MGIRDHYLCQIPLLKSKWSVLPTLKGRGFDHTQAWSLSVILEFCLPQNLSSDPFIWLGLLPLVSLYRILCSFWRVIFQKQVSLPHWHCAQILSLLFRSVGKGGAPTLATSYSFYCFLLGERVKRCNIELSQSTQNPHRWHEITVEKVTSHREIFLLKSRQAEEVFAPGETTEEA